MKKILITSVLALTLLTGCTGTPLTTREKGVGVGALLGAGTGAIVGAAVGHPGAGAAIGGGLGAVGGGLIGNEMQNQEIRQNQTQGEVNHQQREIEHQRRQIRQLQQENETE